MKCKICNSPTDIEFNIGDIAVSICESCAASIFIQQAHCYHYSRSIYNIPKKTRKKPKRHPEKVAEVLNYLYGHLLKKDKVYVAEDLPVAYLESISERLNEGYTIEQLKAVAYSKWKEWKSDPKMSKHIVASTLFRPKNFKQYVAEIPENINPQNTKEQRQLIKELNRFGVRGERNKTTDALARKLIAIGYKKKEFTDMFLL